MGTDTVNVRTVVALCAGFAIAIGAMLVFRAWQAQAAPGDEDMTFVPIEPCRLLDTRPGPDHVGQFDTLGPQQDLAIWLVGQTANQGNCPLLADPGFLGEALELNVTAIGATAPTFITIYPTGPRPLTSSLNPVPGEPPTPNGVTVNLGDFVSVCHTCRGRDSFSIYNHAGSVDVIVDVVGYYTRASLHELHQRVTELERLEQERLDGRRPQTWFKETRDTNRVADAETVLQLDPTLEFVSGGPNLDGTITVNYSANVHEPDVGETVSCTVFPTMAGGSLQSTGGDSQIVGATAFGVTGPQTIQLRCASSNGADITAASLIATYVPN
jgi:hypothetical protein